MRVDWALMRLSEGYIHLSNHGELLCRDTRFYFPPGTLRGFQAPLRQGQLWKMSVLIGRTCLQFWERGWGKEAAERQSSGSSVDSLCPSWAHAPLPEFPEGALNRSPHLLSFTSLHKLALPHTLKPTQIPHPHALRPTPLTSQASPHRAHSYKHILACTHTSLCWVNTGPEGGGGGEEGWCFPRGSQNWRLPDFR